MCAGAQGTGLLTNDAGVRAAVRPLALPLALATVLTGPVCASEGVLLARRQLGFLAAVYVSTIAVLPPVLLAIKQRGGPLVLVWATFALFQFFRAALFTSRIWGRQLGSLLGRNSRPLAHPRTIQDQGGHAGRSPTEGD